MASDTPEELQKWIDEKRNALDEEYLDNRQRIEAEVKRKREETAKQLEEYIKKCWDKTGEDVTRIRQENENQYKEKKDALESLIRIKLQESENKKIQSQSSKMKQGEKSSKQKSTLVVPEVSKSSNITIPKPKSQSDQSQKELTLIRATHGAKLITSESELSNYGFALNKPKQLKSGSTYVLQRGQINLNAKKDDIAVCKVTTLASLPSSVQSHLQEHSLPIVRYICNNEDRKQARHSSFIKVYDIFMNETKLFMFMREYNMTNLEERLQQHGPNSKDEPFFQVHIAGWSRQLSDALTYLHTRFIAHLNIRPENILFDKRDNAKLCGLSKATIYFNEQLENLPKLPKPAASYLPPECYDKPSFDPWHADLWSLGHLVQQIYVLVKQGVSNGTCKNTSTSSSTSRMSRKSSRRGEKGSARRLSLRTVDLGKMMAEALDFIERCMNPNPLLRFKLADLMNHSFLAGSCEQDDQTTSKRAHSKSGVSVMNK